jgi:hypothetical protein
MALPGVGLQALTLDEAGWYVLPVAKRCVALAPPLGTEVARLRFDLGADRVIDLPLSPQSLAELARALGPILLR